MRTFHWIFANALLLTTLPPAHAQGLPPEWETRKDLEVLVAQVKRIGPLLNELKLDEWTAKGAAPAYANQLKSAKDSVGYIVNTAQRLSVTPDRLTLVMETFFRLQSLDAIVNSLAEATARYQNPALAQLLQGVAGENSVNKEKLRQYMLDLAAAKEAEFRVLDQEAQRCRSITSNPTAPKKGTAK